MDYKVKTPVLIIVFNRIDYVKQLVSRLKIVEPKKLYIVSDGPRLEKSNESLICKSVRDYIEKNVDWDCDIIRIYSEVNLGCGKRISTGISKAFETEKKLIILEDDCIPDISFFRFCDEMLEKYESNLKVKMISGCNLLDGEFTDKDYLFSTYGGIWGWATWQSSWESYIKDVDVVLQKIDKISKIGLFEKIIWKDLLMKIAKKKIDTWDYLWDISRMIDKGLVINPKRNLISNIGFGVGSTHTIDQNSKYSKMKTYEIEFPLKFEDEVSVNKKFEMKYRKEILKINFINVLKIKVKAILGK